jgi:DNA-binding transcriptional LysR family regulator
MEISAKYAYEVYREGSFTKAAKKLYISQPSLSASISRLEAEMGFQIFDRSKIPCSLTPEGRIYIESIEEIIESENNMKSRIKALRDTQHGSISVGGSSFASYMILTKICSEFYKKHPKINVTIDIGNKGSSELTEKLENKELDVLVTYSNQDTKYITEPILEERLVIAMNKKLVPREDIRRLSLSREEILRGDYSPEREIEDTSIFRGIEFLDFSRKGDTGRRMAKILGDYKSSRYKIQNARHSEMHYNMMCAGIGATITTTLAIAQKPLDEDILFFMPKSEESYRTVYLAYSIYSSENPLVASFLSVAKSTSFK